MRKTGAGLCRIVGASTIARAIAKGEKIWDGKAKREGKGEREKNSRRRRQTHERKAEAAEPLAQ